MARAKELRAEYGADTARADLNLALLILSSALYEKKRKGGDDYGEHPVSVGFTNTRSNTKKIIGILHDVVEDSDWTLADLKTVGFSRRVVAGVDAMTRREGEAYFDFIERGSLNKDARDKKIEDLIDNMDMSETGGYVSKKDLERTNKYKVAHAYLVAVKKHQVKAGSSVAAFVRSRPDLSGPIGEKLLAEHSKSGLRGAFNKKSARVNSRHNPKKYRKYGQKPYACVPAVLQSVFNRHAFPVHRQEDIGRLLDLRVPTYSRKSFKRVTARAFASTGRYGSDLGMMNGALRQLGIPLRAEAEKGYTFQTVEDLKKRLKQMAKDKGDHILSFSSAALRNKDIKVSYDHVGLLADADDKYVYYIDPSVRGGQKVAKDTYEDFFRAIKKDGGFGDRGIWSLKPLKPGMF